MKKTEAGFTLIESLFVLSLFLIIASISIFFIKPQFLYLEKEQFISQLQADFLYAQQHALSYQSEVIVNILSGEKRYVVYEKGKEKVLIERKIPKEITIMEESMKLFFQFQVDGNINKFGSFAIYTGKEKYRFVFLIGKGRFYVTKE